jgi:hypothetical protein
MPFKLKSSFSRSTPLLKKKQNINESILLFRYAVSQNTFHELPPSLKKRFMGIAGPDLVIPKTPPVSTSKPNPHSLLPRPPFTITYRKSDQKPQLCSSQKITQTIEKPLIVATASKNTPEPPTILKLPTFQMIQKPGQPLSVQKSLSVPPVTLTLKNVPVPHSAKHSQNGKTFVSSYVVKSATIPGHPTNIQVVKRDLTSGAISKIDMPTASGVFTAEKTPAKDSTEYVRTMNFLFNLYIF